MARLRRLQQHLRRHLHRLLRPTAHLIRRLHQRISFYFTNSDFPSNGALPCSSGIWLPFSSYWVSPYYSHSLFSSVVVAILFMGGHTPRVCSVTPCGSTRWMRWVAFVVLMSTSVFWPITLQGCSSSPSPFPQQSEFARLAEVVSNRWEEEFASHALATALSRSPRVPIRERSRTLQYTITVARVFAWIAAELVS
ncbi:hypothetical protein FOZ63_000260 [Perkinsus olseni]|uniref:Uncharacterized protein n=1 Tax=Perkinsus olseni TaxID=32597 RepID=A0A7J6Q2Z5_PEROL|nr:hypothetical protein FOZ63_000260 [Perkinsus olseni]